MYEIKKLIVQDMKMLFTNTMWIFYHTVFPFLLILIMGFLCKSMYGEHITAFDYYGVTFLIYSAFNAATISSNSFMEERIKKGNMRVLYAPINHHWLYLSKIIASTIFTFCCHMIVGIALLACFHIHIGNHIALLLGVLLMCEIFSCCLGVLLCILFKSESASNQMISIIINLSAILGGVFFSMERFGDILAMISWLSPMKWILHATMIHIYDGQTDGLWFCMLGLCLCSIFILMICHALFHEEEFICS